MNLKTLLGLDTKDIHKASLLLVQKAHELKSDGMSLNHIGAKDKAGNVIGDYEVLVNKLKVTPLHHNEPIVVEKKEGEIESTEYYAILVDKPTDKLLNVMLQMFTDLYAQGVIQIPIGELVQANQAMQHLSKTLNERHHEKGWCTDPNCTYKSHKKKS